MKENTKNHRSRHFFSVMILAILVVLMTGFDAIAKPPTAKSLTSEGAKAFGKEDYEGALAKFQEAYEIEPSSSLLYNMGRVCDRKGDLNTAMDYYRRFVTSVDADENARVDALERIETIEKILTIKNGGTLTGASHAANAKGSSAAPSKKSSKSSSPKAAASTGGCVDVNTADVDRLTTLPNIGEVRAKSIIKLRESKGSFASINELDEVSGISAKTIEKLRPLVCAPVGTGSADGAPVPSAKSAPAAKTKTAPAAKNSGKSLAKSSAGNGTVIDL